MVWQDCRTWSLFYFTFFQGIWERLFNLSLSIMLRVLFFWDLSHFIEVWHSTIHLTGPNRLHQPSLYLRTYCVLPWSFGRSTLNLSFLKIKETFSTFPIRSDSSYKVYLLCWLKLIGFINVIMVMIVDDYIPWLFLFKFHLFSIEHFSNKNWIVNR